jgi:hypothetical protein
MRGPKGEHSIFCAASRWADCLCEADGSDKRACPHVPKTATHYTGPAISAEQADRLEGYYAPTVEDALRAGAYIHSNHVDRTAAAGGIVPGVMVLGDLHASDPDLLEAVRRLKSEIREQRPQGLHQHISVRAVDIARLLKALRDRGLQEA